MNRKMHLLVPLLVVLCLVVVGCGDKQPTVSIEATVEAQVQATLTAVGSMVESMDTPMPTNTSAPSTPMQTPAPTNTSAPSTPMQTPAPTNTSAPSTPIPIPPMPTVQVGGEYPVVQLTTKLGVETTVEVKSIDTDNDVLNRVLGLQQGMDFLLRTDDGIYMVVPLRMFRRAYEREGILIVTLANDQEFKGELGFVLDDPQKKSYDLRTVSKVVLLSLPEDEYNIEAIGQEPTVLWELHITKPVDLTYSISNPRFAFQYSSSAGYAIGGADHETESESFYIQIGDEEILANLPDFEEVTFNELAEGETGDQIKLKAPSGVETAGTLILKAEDSKGYHKGRDWFLVMNSSNNELVIVLKNPKCILRKVSD